MILVARLGGRVIEALGICGNVERVGIKALVQSGLSSAVSRRGVALTLCITAGLFFLVKSVGGRIC